MYIGSYEKEHKDFTEMLRILSRYNDVNRIDRLGKTPLYNVAFKRLQNSIDNFFTNRNILENETVLIAAGARVDFIIDPKQGANIFQLIIKNLNFEDKISLESI